MSALESAGAEVVAFSPLHDPLLPPGLHALYLGTGPAHPTGMHALWPALSANRSMLAAVSGFVGAGGVVYAEGGGLAYLSQSVELTGGRTCPMGGWGGQ